MKLYGVNLAHWTPNIFQIATLTTLVQQQDDSMMKSNSEKAALIVRSSQHDASKTAVYIEEYARLLDKYTSACVVRSSKEELAIHKKDVMEKKVSTWTETWVFK